MMVSCQFGRGGRKKYELRCQYLIQLKQHMRFGARQHSDGCEFSMVGNDTHDIIHLHTILWRLDVKIKYFRYFGQVS